MKSTDYSRTVEVFKGSPWEAELVKGLLENNGIATIIKDGLMSTIAPYIAPDVTIYSTGCNHSRQRGNI